VCLGLGGSRRSVQRSETSSAECLYANARIAPTCSECLPGLPHIFAEAFRVEAMVDAITGRNLVENADLGSEELYVLYQAFDGALELVKPQYNASPLTIDFARLKLADAVLRAYRDGLTGVDAIKARALWSSDPAEPAPFLRRRQTRAFAGIRFGSRSARNENEALSLAPAVEKPLLYFSTLTFAARGYAQAVAAASLGCRSSLYAPHWPSAMCRCRQAARLTVPRPPPARSGDHALSRTHTMTVTVSRSMTRPDTDRIAALPSNARHRRVAEAQS
jgi:hypothetical protein